MGARGSKWGEERRGGKCGRGWELGCRLHQRKGESGESVEDGEHGDRHRFLNEKQRQVCAVGHNSGSKYSPNKQTVGRCGPECAEEHGGQNISPAHLSTGHPDAESVQEGACDDCDDERNQDRVGGVCPAAYAASCWTERAFRLAAPVVELPAAVVVALAHRGQFRGIWAHIYVAYAAVVAQAQGALQRGEE